MHRGRLTHDDGAPPQGPTSSYRAVLADSATLSSTNPDMVNAMRAFSLTRAPLPTALPADPALPRRPPELAPDFKVKLLKLAFEYCFSHCGSLVPLCDALGDRDA